MRALSGVSTSGAQTPFSASTGVYQAPSHAVSIANTAMITGTGNCSWVPFDVRPGGQTFDRIAIQVGTAITGGTTVAMRLGIYYDTDNLGGKPGTLLLDAGEVTTFTAAIQALTINQALRTGRYWLGALFTYAAAPTALSIYQHTASLALPGSTWTNNYRCWLLTGASAGSMPAIGAATASVTGPVSVALRAA